MTHDELLTKIEKQTVHIANKIKPVADSCEKDIGGFANALRAVVELHKPGGYEYFEKDICEHCTLDIDYYIFYPCPTIETIEKELS